MSVALVGNIKGVDDNASFSCLGCYTVIAKPSELASYAKSPTEVHLAYKHELSHAVIGESGDSLIQQRVKRAAYSLNAKNKNFIPLACVNCENMQVATLCNFGESARVIIALSLSNCRFGNKTFTKRDKWTALKNLPDFQAIETRDLYVISEDEHNAKNPPLAVRKSDPLKLPSYDFQISGYVNTMLKNSIITLPTGLGKTLIASLVISKFVELNPKRIACMIVNRVPLVFQQGESISEDTGLSVCSMCGENKTPELLKKLYDGEFQVLVITAGALHEALKSRMNYLFPDMFSVVVFDECHHITGNHPYANLVPIFSAAASPPRFLGLSASPVKVKSLFKGITQLEILRQTFGNAQILHWPSVKFDVNSVNLVSASSSSSHDIFRDTCWNLYGKLAEEVNKACGIEIFPSSTGTNRIHHLAVGQIRAAQNLLLRSLQQGLRETVTELLRTLESVLEAMDICQVISLSEAFNRLKCILPFNMIQLVESRLPLQALVDESPSPKLMELMNCLEQFDFKRRDAGRVIVFVQTRDAANLLQSRIQGKISAGGDFIERFCEVEKIVGQSGTDGMRWKGQQEKVVSAFKAGEIDILIATSVLEEGLDVGECELVIRFDPPNSLIQYIQSRGRARKSGKMIVICTSNDEMRFTSVADMETLLQKVLDSEVERQKKSDPKTQIIADAITKTVESEIHALNPGTAAATLIDSLEVVMNGNGDLQAEEKNYPIADADAHSVALSVDVPHFLNA